MATYTKYANGTVVTASGGANAAGFPAFTVFENTVDFTKVSTPLAINDVVQVISIPAGTWVMGVHWKIETVEGAARNFAVGDSTTTNGWITTTSANTLTSGTSTLALTEGMPNTITGYSSGKYYSTASTIDVLAVTAGGLTTAKLRLKVFGLVAGL